MNNQENVQMMLISQQKERMTSQLVSEKVDHVLFPMDEIPEGWLETMKKALKKTAPYSVKATLKDFARVLTVLEEDKPQFSINDFRIVADTLDAVAPEVVNNYQDEPDETTAYNNLVEDTLALVAIFAKKLEELKKEVTVEVETKFQLERAAQNGLKPVSE